MRTRFTLTVLRTASLFALLAIGTACTIDITTAKEQPLAHLVLVWLKEPGNLAHRTRLIEASQRLAAIDGVRRVKVGQSVASDRDVVDDSFDIGLYIELDSPESLRTYATDPLHLEILKTEIRPLTERYIVYDFEIDR